MNQIDGLAVWVSLSCANGSIQLYYQTPFTLVAPVVELLQDRSFGRLESGEAKTVGPMIGGGWSLYVTGCRCPFGHGKFAEFLNLVTDDEAGTIGSVVRPH